MSLDTITFGKYRGSILVDVLRDDRDYCVWLSKNKHLINNDMHEFLVNSLESEELYDESYRVNFGKHKSKSLEWIAKYDKPYLTYLKSSEYVQNNMTRLRAELEKY